MRAHQNTAITPEHKNILAKAGIIIGENACTLGDLDEKTYKTAMNALRPYYNELVLEELFGNDQTTDQASEELAL